MAVEVAALDHQVQFLKTLSDPTRMKLLKLILHEEMCVCELQDLLQISQPAVSQHIAKLKPLGLVRERKAGAWTYYQGDWAQLTAALGGLATFLAADPATIPAMADLMERRCQINRTAACGEGGGRSC